MFARFFSLFSLSLFPRLCCFCSGPSALTQLCDATTARSNTAYHRSGRAPFGRFGILLYVKKFILVIFCHCFAPALRAGQHAISLSRVSGSRGEALRVTLTRHMTHGVCGLGRSNSDKDIHSPGPIYSFSLPTPEGMAPKHDNKVLLSLPKNEVRGGMFSVVF